jgi:hypothetical protein
MPDMTLDIGDAAELAELLQFLSDWLTHDRDHLGISLADFVGNSAYNTQHLRDDLDRFTFLLSGNDGQALFSPRQPRSQR